MSLWQDVTVEERGTDAAYRSTTTINQVYHDEGATWNTTIPPQPANAGYMQQGGSPAASVTAPVRPTPTPSTSTQASTVPPREPTPGSSPEPWVSTQNLLVSQPIRTWTRPLPGKTIQCDFVNALGIPCEKVVQRFDRHWITCHALAELRAIQLGKLRPQEAMIITSVPILELIGRHQLKCPFGCQTGKYPTVFSRQEHLRRHLHKGNCIAKFSSEQIRYIARKTVVDCGWRDTMNKLMKMGVVTWHTEGI